jgi:hypothetical protein
MKTTFTLLAVLLFASPSFQRPSHHHHEQTTDSERDFDYLVLRQIWPKTSCRFPGEHQCTIGDSVSSWVVHGLWYWIIQNYILKYVRMKLLNFSSFIKGLTIMLATRRFVTKQTSLIRTLSSR